MLEMMGIARDNSACRKLLGVIPVQVIDGKTHVSPLAPITEIQLAMLVAYHRITSG